MISFIIGIACGLLIAEIFYDGWLMGKTRVFIDWIKVKIGIKDLTD